MQGEVRAEATSLRNDRDALEKRVTELEEDLQRSENKLEKVNALAYMLYQLYAVYHYNVYACTRVREVMVEV
jgi:uncharacterized protein involved in exopolysaccharide biosynthesis